MFVLTIFFRTITHPDVLMSTLDISFSLKGVAEVIPIFFVVIIGTELVKQPNFFIRGNNSL